MKKLNLGCGNNYHIDWINVDFVSSSKDIMQYDLKKVIPFNDEVFDIIYHSHLLEHFTKREAIELIKGCYRVLKQNGIIRIVLPDLEKIAKEYLEKLQGALDGDEIAKENYNWILLEMYDQTVRNSSGGEMMKYLCKEKLLNEDYIYSRIGEEGSKIRKSFLELINNTPQNNISKIQINNNILKKITTKSKNTLKEWLFKEEIENYEKYKEEIKIGKFRLSGEIHQWMYDRYSLAELLRQHKFKNIEIKTAFTSDIPDWDKYQLDVINGKVRKPDSLYMEAIK